MFSFFRRKKKQETPAQEETRIQKTTAEAVEHAETTVSQTLETVQENIGEKAEELMAAVETAVESAKEHAEEICETLVEHVSETVEHVHAVVSETSSETVEQVEERVEAIRETVAENVSAAVEHVHEAVSDGSSETAEAVETQAEAAPAASEENSVPVFDNTAVATSSETSEPSETEPKLGWAARLKQGLTKSRDKMAKSLAGVFGGGQIDEDLYEELETVLITSDMGMEATEYLMKDVRNRVSLKGLKDGNELRGALKEALYDLIKPLEKPLVLPDTKEPFVIMLAGINGAGKTTSIGKLAKYFQSAGQICAACRRRHLPRRRPRAASSMGRTQQRNRHFANHGRFRRRLLRCRPSRQSARHRHRAGRHRRPSAHAASFDGRNQKSEARAAKSDARCAARNHRRPRCQTSGKTLSTKSKPLTMRWG